VGWFQELGGGAALQGFVSKHIRTGGNWGDQLESNFNCGMALECAIPWLSADANHGCHFFVEALGKYRPGGPDVAGPAMSWEVIPGIHWRMGENWWVSIGAARKSLITWSWQF
jgi:hypothetical protein